MTAQSYRCGWVALMGPPNAGKSTLLNALLGQKVTIVTPKPQTTRNQIVGIHTDETAQTVFMDTPGLSQVRGRLSKAMLQAVWQSLNQADVIMPVLDSHLYIRHPDYLERDLAPVAEALASETRPMIVVVNKVDLFADKSRMLPLLTRLSEMWPSAEIFPVSALMKDGLPALMELIRSRLPEGEAQFPDDQISFDNDRCIACHGTHFAFNSVICVVERIRISFCSLCGICERCFPLLAGTQTLRRHLLRALERTFLRRTRSKTRDHRSRHHTCRDRGNCFFHCVFLPCGSPALYTGIILDLCPPVKKIFLAP